jgi:hypothetical protein
VLALGHLVNLPFCQTNSNSITNSRKPSLPLAFSCSSSLFLFLAHPLSLYCSFFLLLSLGLSLALLSLSPSFLSLTLSLYCPLSLALSLYCPLSHSCSPPSLPLSLGFHEIVIRKENKKIIGFF